MLRWAAVCEFSGLWVRFGAWNSLRSSLTSGHMYHQVTGEAAFADTCSTTSG